MVKNVRAIKIKTNITDLFDFFRPGGCCLRCCLRIVPFLEVLHFPYHSEEPPLTTQNTHARSAKKKSRKKSAKFSPADFAPFFARDFPRTWKKWGSLWPWEGVELLINDAVRHDSHRDRALNLDASVAMLRLKQRRVSLFRETVIAHLRYSYCSDTSHGRLNHFFAVANFHDLCLNAATFKHFSIFFTLILWYSKLEL